jgi:hypothetical protein
MMGIAPDVMLADIRKIMVGHTFFVDGRIGAGIVLGRAMEFRPAKFGQIVTESMEKDAHMGRIPQDLMPMFCDGQKMFERMTHESNS